MQRGGCRWAGACQTLEGRHNKAEVNLQQMPGCHDYQVLVFIPLCQTLDPWSGTGCMLPCIEGPPLHHISSDKGKLHEHIHVACVLQPVHKQVPDVPSSSILRPQAQESQHSMSMATLSPNVQPISSTDAGQARRDKDRAAGAQTAQAC